MASINLQIFLKHCLLPAALMVFFQPFAQTPSTQVYPSTTTKTVNPVPAAYGGTLEASYVRSWEALKPIPDEATLTSVSRTNQEVKKATQYYDGLGRPLQTVSWQQSPLGKDVVSPVIYDEYGRETFNYLPYTSTSADGNFKLNPFNEQSTFLTGLYNPTANADGEKFFYAKTDFESSPLNRVTKTYAPGNSWAGRGVGTAKQYFTNKATDSVRIWNIGATAGGTPTSTGFYAAGLLYKTLTTNERGYDAVEYTDKEGKLILKKVEITVSSYEGPTGWYNTYYIYDDLGNLRYVIQPKGTDWLKINNWTFDASTWQGSTIAKELSFSYEYDERNRMTVKRVPGAGETWMVYDARNRLVMTQDSMNRANGRWEYTRYDSLNRPVRTGLWVTTGNRAFHQNLASGSIIYPSPVSGDYISTETYYDNYAWVSSSGSGLSSTLITANGVTGTSYFYSASNTAYPYPQALSASSQTRGMVTGTKTRILGETNYLYTVSFYDDRGRMIQSHSNNYSGGKDTITTQYSFTSQALVTLVCHQKAGTNSQKYRVRTKMEYDAGGRLLKVYKQAGTSPLVTITDNQYDELGQLKRKYIGKVRDAVNQNTYTSTPVDGISYDYNIRGWLRGINKDYARNENGASKWFGMELCYDYGFTTNYVDGNIGGIRWRSKGDGEQRSYGFTYDAVNRLTKGNFTQYSGSSWDISAGVDFSVPTIGYDQNGNITKMYQKGLVLNTSKFIDSLNYGYFANSNKLNFVTDLENDINSKLGDFKEINNNTTQDYFYDGNGSLTKDNNKSISSIRYTHLNLPDSIVVTGKGYIKYVYDAAGTKLRKITVDHTVGPTETTTTDYLGLFTYQNDTLQFIAQEEGRIRPKRAGDGDTMYYDYFEKDHLGNTRAVLTDEIQKDMYPVASLETTPLPGERNYYDRLDSGRVNKSTIAGYPSDTYTTPNDYVQKLKGNAVKIGASTMLKVMSGDKITVRVNSWYNAPGVTPSTPASPLADIVLALTGDIPAVSGGKIAASQLSSTILNPQVTDFLDSRDAANVSSKPKAYLNIVLLDEQLKPVVTNDGDNSYFQQVSTNNSQETISVTDRDITNNGYLYIYVSNETPNIDVIFDNLQVTQTRGPLLEETHYYPFGLTMAGISYQAAGKLENRYKYNKGSELQHKEFSEGSGLETYATQFRMLDPQLGRWWQIDPKPDMALSPYSAMNNNPISINDYSGDTPRAPLKILIPQKKWPDVYKTLMKFLASGKKPLFTYDSDKKAAKRRSAQALAGHAPAAFGNQLHEFPPKMVKEGGKGALVDEIDALQNQQEGGTAGRLIQLNGLKTGDKILYVPIPDEDNQPNDDVPVAAVRQKNNNSEETQKSPGKVININPDAVKTGAKGVAAAVGLYLLWKGIEFIGSLPICGGCAVLSPL